MLLLLTVLPLFAPFSSGEANKPTNLKQPYVTNRQNHKVTIGPARHAQRLAGKNKRNKSDVKLSRKQPGYYTTESLYM